MALVVDRREEALLVPESAVFARDQKQLVYRVVDGRAVQTEVVLGQRRPGQVEPDHTLAGGEPQPERRAVVSVDDPLGPARDPGDDAAELLVLAHPPAGEPQVLVEVDDGEARELAEPQRGRRLARPRRADDEDAPSTEQRHRSFPVHVYRRARAEEAARLRASPPASPNRSRALTTVTPSVRAPRPGSGRKRARTTSR